MAIKPALDAGNELTLDYINILQKQYKKKELYSMLDVPKSLWVVNKETFNFSFVRKEKDGSAPCSHLPPHVEEDWWTATFWQVKDKNDKYNFRSNSKTCVENIKIAIQESKFINVDENMEINLVF